MIEVYDDLVLKSELDKFGITQVEVHKDENSIAMVCASPTLDDDHYRLCLGVGGANQNS